MDHPRLGYLDDRQSCPYPQAHRDLIHQACKDATPAASSTSRKQSRAYIEKDKEDALGSSVSRSPAWGRCLLALEVWTLRAALVLAEEAEVEKDSRRGAGGVPFCPPSGNPLREEDGTVISEVETGRNLSPLESAALAAAGHLEGYSFKRIEAALLPSESIHSIRNRRDTRRGVPDDPHHITASGGVVSQYHELLGSSSEDEREMQRKKKRRKKDKKHSKKHKRLFGLITYNDNYRSDLTMKHFSQ